MSPRSRAIPVPAEHCQLTRKVRIPRRPAAYLSTARLQTGTSLDEDELGQPDTAISRDPPLHALPDFAARGVVERIRKLRNYHQLLLAAPRRFKGRATPGPEPTVGPADRILNIMRIVVAALDDNKILEAPTHP